MFFLSPLMNVKIFMINISLFTLNIIFLMFLWNITKCVNLFSKNYMTFWNNYFNTMIMLFMASMMMLIVSNSWLALFLGWELLGLTSFMLILYYGNWNSMEGSLLTMMTNRLGDMFFMLSLVFFSVFKTNFMITIVVMMAITKSSQFPFSSWLPAAMAAPTPVSSLVHSSTLVTAGIFVFFRFHMLINYYVNKSMAFLFLVTMLLGSLSALIESDLKKLIAFSTLSQLGMIFLSFYSSFNSLVMFHLLVHAIFKSVLFIVAGFVIWSMCSQLMSSSFSISMCLCCLTFMSAINMMGFVFTSGFLSKDTLVFSTTVCSLNFNILIMMVLSFTLLYSVRLLMFMMSNLMLNSYYFDLKFMFIMTFYTSMMLLMGRLWLNNLDYSLNFTGWLKTMLMLLLISILFYPMILFSLFKNLNRLNSLLSKTLLTSFDKDVNFFTYMFYSLEAKLLNSKSLLLICLGMILL